MNYDNKLDSILFLFVIGIFVGISKNSFMVLISFAVLCFIMWGFYIYLPDVEKRSLKEWGNGHLKIGDNLFIRWCLTLWALVSITISYPLIVISPRLFNPLNISALIAYLVLQLALLVYTKFFIRSVLES